MFNNIIKILMNIIEITAEVYSLKFDLRINSQFMVIGSGYIIFKSCSFPSIMLEEKLGQSILVIIYFLGTGTSILINTLSLCLSLSLCTYLTYSKTDYAPLWKIDD